jgi:putative hydrolase of the HAD superfamily
MNNNQGSVNAIVFDLGGTLIDYAGNHTSWPELEKPGLTAAYNLFFHSGTILPDLKQFIFAGFEILPQRWKLATSGIRNLTVASFLLEILDHLEVQHPDNDTLELTARTYEKAICNSASPIAEGKEVLAELKSRGYKLGLISNTMFSREAHLDDMRRFGLDSYFDSMLFSAESNKWKPNIAPFSSILSDLKELPANSVFVGDDPAADIIGGKAAGMNVVHFLSSNRFPSVNGANPDATIHTLPELIPVIAKISGR